MMKGFLVYFLILCGVLWEQRTIRGEPTNSSVTFDVTEFGAVGDGVTDDTQAFDQAWKAACSEDSMNTTVIVPCGSNFSVSSLIFEGPCKSQSITFLILGSIVAAPKEAWENTHVKEWLHFKKVTGLSVVGNDRGMIDGLGHSWWPGHGHENHSPSALRFSNCDQLQISGLKHKDSQRNHISITECNYANISNLYIAAPATSPNTDGIDISSSSNIQIQDSIMETGDDCIAINGGTSSLYISRITCGPGHGISIGSLGKDGRRQEVEGIFVDNCTFVKTQNGVRIKTWKGGSGFAKNITFSNITFEAAGNPIIINQYYCDHQCDDDSEEETSAVEVSDVRFLGLHGTFSRTNDAINFTCSKVVPCTGIVIEDVDITSTDPEIVASASCNNAYGTSRLTFPAVECLQS